MQVPLNFAPCPKIKFRKPGIALGIGLNPCHVKSIGPRQHLCIQIFAADNKNLGLVWLYMRASQLHSLF